MFISIICEKMMIFSFNRRVPCIVCFDEYQSEHKLRNINLFNHLIQFSRNIIEAAKASDIDT